MAVKYVNFRGLEVSAPWGVVLRAAEKAGVKFSLNSGHRTMAEQKVLFDRNMHLVNGHWVPKPGHPLTAVPSSTAPHIRVGREDHALDMDPGSTEFGAFCLKHGLRITRPVVGEHWHIEAFRGAQLRSVAKRLEKFAGKPKRHKIPAARYLMADLSSNNDQVDLAAYKAAGHRAIALKATEGVSFIDPTYVSRVGKAHALGLKVVHYHFARPDNHPTAAPEAVFFAKVVKPHLKRGDRVCLDLEKDTAHQTVNLSRYAQEFLDDVSKLLKVSYPWLYSYTAFIRGNALKTPSKTRLWLADYSAPILGARGRITDIWAHQFTNGVNGPRPHSMAGLGSHVDVSKLSRRALLGMRIK